MASLETLIARRDTLEEVMALGHLEVTYEGGTTVRFRSRAEMVGALNDIKRQIRDMSGEKPRNRWFKVVADQGL